MNVLQDVSAGDHCLELDVHEKRSRQLTVEAVDFLWRWRQPVARTIYGSTRHEQQVKLLRESMQTLIFLWILGHPVACKISSTACL